MHEISNAVVATLAEDLADTSDRGTFESDGGDALDGYDELTGDATDSKW